MGCLKVVLLLALFGLIMLFIFAPFLVEHLFTAIPGRP